MISYWRIVPKRIGPDDFVHRFKSRGEAEATLTAMRKRHAYCVAPFNEYGKRIDAMPERSADMSEAPRIEPIEDITDEDITAPAEQTSRSDVRSEADQSESMQLETVARALAKEQVGNESAWIAYRRLARIAIEAYEGRLASDERLER